MTPVPLDRSETIRLGRVLLPVVQAARPSLSHLQHDTWFAEAPCLLELFHDYATKHGFRCTHAVIKHRGVNRHRVIFSNGAGAVFEAEAEDERLAAARAAERLILRRI